MDGDSRNVNTLDAEIDPILAMRGSAVPTTLARIATVAAPQAMTRPRRGSASGRAGPIRALSRRRWGPLGGAGPAWCLKRLRTTIPSRLDSQVTDRIALGLRLGLGSVFIAGGWWKLSRAIDPLRSEAFVDRYLASNGYINSFFDQYLFAGPGALLTPLAFLEGSRLKSRTAGIIRRESDLLNR